MHEDLILWSHLSHVSRALDDSVAPGRDHELSRGPVVNEDDLVRALRSRIIAGAGLDVFSQEPVSPTNHLLAMENVFATPHVAGVTRQNYAGIGRIVANNILLLKSGQVPHYCVNPQVFAN